MRLSSDVSADTSPINEAFEYSSISRQLMQRELSSAQGVVQPLSSNTSKQGAP